MLSCIPTFLLALFSFFLSLPFSSLLFASSFPSSGCSLEPLNVSPLSLIFYLLSFHLCSIAPPLFDLLSFSLIYLIIHSPLFAQISSSPLTLGHSPFFSNGVCLLSPITNFLTFLSCIIFLPSFLFFFSFTYLLSLFSYSVAFLSTISLSLSIAFHLSLLSLFLVFLSLNIHLSQFYTSSFPSPLLFISLFTLPHFSLSLSCFSLAIVFLSLSFSLLFLSCLYPSPLFSSLTLFYLLLSCFSSLCPSVYSFSLVFLLSHSLFYCFLHSCSHLNLFHLFVPLSLFLILFLFPSHLFLCHMTIFSLIFLSLQTQAFPFNSDVFFFFYYPLSLSLSL